MSQEDFLDELLTVAANQLEKKSSPSFKETSLFKRESNVKDTTNEKSSIIHSGDTDSSDDEDNKYYEERKYNDYGKDIKHLLQSSSASNLSLPRNGQKKNDVKAVATSADKVQTDPIFGLRIINPLVSFTTLQERMTGREAVNFARIKNFVLGNISDKNWVISGVIVGKSNVKTSQKGTQYLIWTLSDLKHDIKTISVFLFDSAYKQLWKTPIGTAIGILNPSVLDKKDGSKVEAVLSVTNAQTVLIMGQSKDFGLCKSVKKNGDKCTNIVNTSQCEFCIYHIKQEYQKCSKRSELQSNFTGKGLTALRNKVLGKNEVFYAGKSYTAIPAKRNQKLMEKDKGRLDRLSGNSVPNFSERVLKKNQPKRAAANLEVSHKQRLRDLELLEKLGGSADGKKTDFNAAHSAEVTSDSSRNTVVNVLAKLKTKSVDKIEETDKSKPVLQNLKLNPGKEGLIDLSASITPKQMSKAKLNALKYIREKGPLKKTDPNRIKKDSPTVKKRSMEDIENNPKKLKTDFQSDRFKKMMEATSKHMDLLEHVDSEEQEKYFQKLEAREKMEDKMINTSKVPCKAVRCLQCKYTHFSAAQVCKDEKHPLRVFDAVKRFFRCGDCGNRTQCLEIIPTQPCNNCGSGKWQKTGMMKEKTVTLTHSLSIRGGEQKFVNSVVSDVNINLLMPED